VNALKSGVARRERGMGRCALARRRYVALVRIVGDAQASALRRLPGHTGTAAVSRQINQIQKKYSKERFSWQVAETLKWKQAVEVLCITCVQRN